LEDRHPLPKRIILALIVLVIPVLVFAVSEAACIFLLIEPSSRSGGLGQAHVAQADDGFAAYWNPGALAFNRKSQAAFMHTNWLGDVDGINDMYIEYLGYHQYFPELDANMGAHFIYLTYGEQEARDANNNLIRVFSSYELAFALSFASQISDNLGLGMNFKFIFSNLSPVGTGNTETNAKGQGMSYAFDFGIKYKNLLLKRLDFGANLQNIGPDITFINEAQSDPLPMNLRLGLSYRLLDSDLYKLALNGDMNKLLANNDFVLARILTAWYDDKPKQEIDAIIFSTGAEFLYWDLLALRGGFIYDKAGSIIGPSFGVGIQYSIAGYKLSFDFAMQQGGELTEYNKTFSLGLEF